MFPTKHYGDVIQEHEIGRASDMRERERRFIQVFRENFPRKKPLGRPRRRWKDNVDVKKVICRPNLSW